MTPSRLGYRNPWALLALVAVIWVSGWLVTWGNWGWTTWEPQGSLFDWQASSLWQEGRWDVPEKVTHVETFLVDGKAYMYFGPGPALLRFLAYAFGDLEPGSWSRIFVFLGICATLACILALVEWICRIRIEEGTMPRLHRGWVGALILLLGFSTTLPFIASRAFVYHEAILLGAGAALGSFLALANYLREPRPAALVACGGFGVLSILSRASVGGGTVVALGATAVVLLVLPLLRGRLAELAKWCGIEKRADTTSEGLLAAMLTLTIIGSFGFVNHQKFGTIFEGVPLRYHVSYQEEGRLEKVGGALLHLRNVPRNLYSYLHPKHVLFDETFPWIYPTLESAIPLPASEAEPPAGLGRPSRRIRVYTEPEWIETSLFPGTYGDFVERYASATAVMPGVLLLGVIGFVSILRGAGGVGRYLRLPLFGALAGSFPFLMSAGITHRFLHDAFPVAAITCSIGLLAIASADRGAAKKSLVGCLLVLGLWGAWANFALGLEYQRIYSWGTNFFFKTDFNKTQFAIDKRIGDLLGYEVDDAWTPKSILPPK